MHVLGAYHEYYDYYVYKCKLSLLMISMMNNDEENQIKICSLIMTSKLKYAP